jgi:hypothetical protein
LDSRLRTLLGPNRLDPLINAELADAYVSNVMLITPEPLPETDLVEELESDNRASFVSKREKLPPSYSVSNSLLLFKGRLCVNRNTPLCTQLIREVHNQVSSAHPSSRKTYQLLAPKYYWMGMSTDCKRYVDNYISCKLYHSD